jgi:hypothetical protein
VGTSRKSLFSANEIAFLTVPLLFVASLWVIPEPLYVVAYASGRAGVCPLKQSASIRQVVNELNKTTQAIEAKSTIEVKDAKAGLWRWKTPYGTCWGAAWDQRAVPTLRAGNARLRRWSAPRAKRRLGSRLRR